MIIFKAIEEETKHNVGTRGARRAILEHLKKHGKITSMEAFELYGVTRLSAIIFDFRKCGYLIDTIDTVCRTRFDETCVYATYVYRGREDE